jgi:hypothetical protein
VTRGDYTDALERLGLSHANAAKLLGVDSRTSRRYADGTRPIPRTVENLLKIVSGKNIKPAEAIGLVAE